ncbi:hypothetical protein [Pseudobacter ginsenosidimutans]|uniref:hypothetical protein n=1 Tax=Pseudobacter ginsenosidimutans TaxID=661488 RepID=UPI00102DE71A|nr:hypothetical protein [Pseudobacter ginsenosidimutans]QEC41252.1 hypothetical protein FSB84_05940 [Pseudobacter ginsenosidimutans]
MARSEHFVETELDSEDTIRLKNLIHLIDGFSSELSLEILATTDYILKDNPSLSLEGVMNKIWNERKKELFKEEHVSIAYKQLLDYSDKLA